jgi:hypothetical protein
VLGRLPVVVLPPRTVCTASSSKKWLYNAIEQEKEPPAMSKYNIKTNSYADRPAGGWAPRPERASEWAGAGTECGQSTTILVPEEGVDRFDRRVAISDDGLIHTLVAC